MSYLIELQDTCKCFGGLKAVDHVNLAVKDGDLHCLIGPNGAGKTTIFKLIMGIYVPTKGRMIFNGKDITKLPTWKRVREGISIKMQVPGVYLDLSLYDNIRIAIQRCASSKNMSSEIERLIELVGIKEIGNPLVRNMPHGQQQWLEIAMALASKPKLLLLDEPAAGLGPEETEFTAEIVKRIFKMRSSGMSPHKIADRLNEEGIASPSKYCMEKYGIVGKRNNFGLWSVCPINSILKNPT